MKRKNSRQDIKVLIGTMAVVLAVLTGCTVPGVEKPPVADQAAQPVFTPPGGTYEEDQSVVLTCATPDAVIRYTTDGSPPTGASPEYTAPIAVAGDGVTVTIRALAEKADMTPSSVATHTYTVNTSRAARPVFSPEPGDFYHPSPFITITSATPGASIRYTTNGDDPTPTTGTLYTNSFVIGGTTTIKALAYKTGLSNSVLTQAAYTYTAPPAPGAPYLAPHSGWIYVSFSRDSRLNYDLYWNEGDDVDMGTARVITNVTPPVELHNVTNGTEYACLLVARNSAGSSEAGVVATATPQKEWQFMGDPGLTSDWAYRPSLAVDPSGTPYVAFYTGNDYSQGPLSVMTFDGTAWQPVGVAGIGGYMVTDPTLVMFGDAPCVAFTEPGNDNRLHILAYNGTVWDEIDSPAAAHGAQFKYELKAHGQTLTLGYREYDTGYFVVEQYTGGVWTSLGTSTLFKQMEDFALAVDETGAPFVAVQALNIHDWIVYVEKYNNGAWHLFSVSTPEIDHYQEFALAARNNTAYIATTGSPLHDNLTVLGSTGAQWQVVGAATLPDVSDMDEVRLVLDDQGTLYLGLYDYRRPYYNSGRVMKFDNMNWTTIDSLFAAVSMDNLSLAFSGGVPYFAYKDSNAGNSISVRVYR